MMIIDIGLTICLRECYASRKAFRSLPFEVLSRGGATPAGKKRREAARPLHPLSPSPLPKYRNLDGPDVKHYDKESKPSGGLGGERRGGHGGKEGGRTGHQRVETLPPPFFLLLPLSPTLLSCPSTSFLPPATPSWETHRAPRDKASLTPASGCRISASMGRPGRGG